MFQAMVFILFLFSKLTHRFNLGLSFLFCSKTSPSLLWESLSSVSLTLLLSLSKNMRLSSEHVVVDYWYGFSSCLVLASFGMFIVWSKRDICRGVSIVRLFVYS